MAFVMRNEEKLYYNQIGNTDSPYTLIFIHGATMTGAGLLPLASSLDQYNCIILDLPGHGNSVGETQHSVEDFTDRVQYLIEQLVEEKIASGHVIPIGFSMGGSITLELTFRKVSAVKRAVILSSGCDMKGGLPLIEAMLQNPYEDYKIEDVYPAMFGQNIQSQEKERIIEYFMKTRSDDKVGYMDLAGVSNYDRLDGLKDVEIPVLAVCGDEDIVVPVGRALHIRQYAKNSALCIVPYCGHALYMEEPEKVVNAIKDFIEHTNHS